ncbi:hypothetical protein KBX50_24800 [Micromonospora sp. C51]|uniref:hypothetical protein n=1 Tax=Micromonospora sp. C51 TaxID=2824879 RepID=UPI001B388409|nr:hypothetical protein [Micromonospora sp. C51]MBQ1051673.1 hypothetical protein [Micromonospora sp. C51]
MAVVVDLLNITIILHGLLKLTAITNAIRWISERAGTTDSRTTGCHPPTTRPSYASWSSAAATSSRSA